MASRALKLELLADSKKFGKGLDQGKSKLSKFGGAAKKIGKGLAAGVGAAAALGGAAFAMANKVTQGHDKIHKSASKMGVTTDLYQELDYWATQNGMSSDTMERAVGRLTQRMGRAGEGNEKYAEAFERVGVSIRDSNGEMRDTSEVLPEVIEKLGGIEDPATRSAVAGELLGTKMARDLMPALEDGALSLEDATEKAREMGIVIGEDAIDSSVKFQDSLDSLKRKAGSMLQKGMQPVIAFFADKAMPFIENTLLPNLERFAEWIGPKLTEAAKKLSTFFTDKVMPVLRTLRDWFVEKVLPAAAKLYVWFTGTLVPGIRRTVVPIIEAFRDALQKIKAKFDENSGALKKLWTKFLKPLVTFIVTKVAPVVGTVLGGALSTLGEIIGGVIDGVGWLVEAIEKVVGWFQRMYAKVKKLLQPLQRVADLAGRAMDAVGNIGGGIMSGVRSVIPGLASGGIVTRPTLAMVGEGRESEAVLPLSKLRGLLGQSGQGVTINVTGTMLDPEGVARAVERALHDARRRTGGRVA